MYYFSFIFFEGAVFLASLRKRRTEKHGNARTSPKFKQNISTHTDTGVVS